MNAAQTVTQMSPVQILVILTGLTLLPALLMALTPLLRITLVLHFLRQALGTQTAPSNQVLLGLGLTLTLVLMQPTLTKLREAGLDDLLAGKASYEEVWVRAEPVLKTYLLRSCREKDLALFVQIQKLPAPKAPADLPITVVSSAYVLSELRVGFQLGAALFLPFLLIDLVVSALTLSLGMVQLPPVMVSAPLKILLFVAVDGWNLLIGSLMRSFAV